VNPWHFRAPLAPLWAARKENHRVCLREVVTAIRRVSRGFDCIVVEGAGGLLSPLGEDFDSRDLLRALGARPLIVCPNRLGVVNQALLVLAALPRGLACCAPVILSAASADSSSASNVSLLRELLGAQRVQVLPRVNPAGKISPGVRTLLSALVASD
jgi:dethiobiotin synthetase